MAGIFHEIPYHFQKATQHTKAPIRRRLEPGGAHPSGNGFQRGSKSMRYGKRVAAIAVAASLVLVACGDDDQESGTGDTSAPEGTTAATDAPASGDTTPAARTTAGTTGGGGGGESILGTTIPCDQQYDGKTVSVFSPVRNSENEPDAVATVHRLLPAVHGLHRCQDRLPGHRPVRARDRRADPGRQPTRRHRLPAAGSVAHARRERRPDPVPRRPRGGREQRRLHPRLARARHGRRPGLRDAVARQHQVVGVVQPGDVRGRRL